MARRVRKEEEAAAAPLPPWRVRTLLALAAGLLALFASHRCATVLSQPGGRFEDPDAAFHARRAMRAVEGRTLLPPVFDRWENFPEGGRAVWPPLHDATLAMLARLGGSTPAEPARGMPLAAAFPVIELALVVFAAAALARRFAGGRGALLAGWLVALTPALARRGAYGEIDHNVTEVLAALLLALAAGGVGSLRGRWRLAAPFLFAAAVLFALGFYAGLVLSAGLVSGAVLLGELLDPDPPRGGPAIAAGFGIAALLLPLFAGLRVKPDPADPWRLGPVYALLLAVAAVGLGAAALLAWRRARERTRAELFTTLGAVAAGLLAMALQPRAAWPAMAKGLGFFGSREVWLSGIEEFRPVFGALHTMPAFAPALLPAIAALVLAAAVLRREGSRRMLAILVPALAFLALGLLQRRFLPPACAFGAVAAGAALAFPGRARRAALLLAAAVGVLVAVPWLLRFVDAVVKREPAPIISAGEAVGSILADAAPPSGAPPRWGVLAPWDYGHQILRASGQAVALNNFGSMQAGFAKKLAIFLETSPARALEELDANRIRYVVAAFPTDVVPPAAAILGRDARRYFPDGFDPDRRGRYEPTAEGERTLLVRLHLRGGRPLPDDTAEDAAALARFRELWASPEEAEGPGGRPLPFMRLFEVLPASSARS